MKKTVLWTACLLAGCFFSACNKPAQAPAKEKKLPEHVILVGFDGFSAHSLNNGAEMPTLRKMMAEGAYTLKNRSVLPSSSAVNWASMFMGAGPELHGYTEWNSRTPELPSRIVNADNRFPNIFGLYRDRAPHAEIGLIYEWEGIHYLADTLALNYERNTPVTEENPDGCTPFALQYIQEKKPNFFAVIYDQPDHDGHEHGWMSKEYMDNLKKLDGYLAQILKAVENAAIMDKTVILVVADHGGKDTGHGGKSMEEMQTPIVLYGKGVRRGHPIETSTMVYDITGTLAYLLDVEQPQVWIARPLLTAFY